jgi:7-carboxy-7-deazaguanine synthase
MLEVTEIYKSVQGESTYIGLPCVFVRLTGCNLRCVWCDTTHAFHNGGNLSIDQIVDQVKSYGINLVEITGGEPLLQKEVFPLMESLLINKFQVMLETSGSLSIKNVPKKVIKILDLKCPGSGEENKNLWENLNHLASTDEIKFVIADKVDYEWSKKVLQDYKLDQKIQILFSPVFEKLKLKDLTEWILEDNLPVRLHTQLHKYIWDPKTIGV